jgi:hypothetical protein
MLLFDIAEPAIGPWENQLGYRGMIEMWRKSGTQQFVCMEPCECGEDWEAWLGDDETGNSESLAFGTFDEVDKASKDWMKKEVMNEGVRKEGCRAS